MKTFRIPVIVLALAASLATSVSLGNASAVATELLPASMQAGAAADPHACQRLIANAFPTAEAGFAARRPVGDRT